MAIEEIVEISTIVGTTIANRIIKIVDKATTLKDIAASAIYMAIRRAIAARNKINGAIIGREEISMEGGSSTIKRITDSKKTRMNKHQTTTKQQIIAKQTTACLWHQLHNPAIVTKTNGS